jgi:PAS domain S-box-containing protein
MMREKNSVGARRAVETLLGEDQAVRWSRPVLRIWGFLFVGFVFLFVWLPIRATPAGSKALLWIVIYTVYLFCLEIFCKQAKRLYETSLFRLFRVHFNLAMIAFLVMLAPPIASGYLWFFFSLPILAVLLYFGRLLPLLITYLEVCAGMLVLTCAQGWPAPPDFVAMVAQDAILGLLAAVLYFFVHFFPRLREENTILKAATTLIQVLDQKELCQLLADAAKAGVPASDAAVVHLLGGEDNETLVPHGSSNIDLTTLGRSLMGIGIGVAGHAIQSRETINVPDVDKDDRYRQLPPSFIPFKSLLVAPMYVGGKNVGTISVHSIKEGVFNERDKRFLTTLAAQGATAIANAELYDTRTRRRQQISDILEASRIFGLHQLLDTLLKTIATEVCRCSGYRIAVVNLLDEASNEIVVKAMTGVSPAGSRKLEGMRIPLDAIQFLFQDEFRISRSYFIRHDRRPEIPGLDQYTFTAALGERKPGEWHQEDMLIVPIQTQEEELLGYISVDDPSDRQLPSLDTVQTLEVLASVAATAIQNARLYEQAQKEIVERKQVEEALRESEARYRSLFDRIPIGMYRTTPAGQFLDANPGLVQMMGYPDRESLLSVNAIDLFVDSADRTQELALLEQEGIIQAELQLRRRDGALIWVQDDARAIRDADDQVICYEGSVQDMTERKRAQEALQRRNRELELLNRVGQAFVSTLDLDQVIVTVLEEVRGLLSVVACSLWLIDPTSHELVCRQATGPQSEIVRGWRLAPGEGLGGCVVRSGESLIVPDTRADRRHFKGVDQQTGLEMRSTLIAPLRVKEDVIGVLQAVDTEIDRFKPTDLTLVEPLAASAAIAIENARLYEETDSLRAFNENIVQSMEEGILLEDGGGHITFVNRRMAELLGYNPEELTGQHWKTIVSPEVMAKVEEETAKRPQGIASQYETALLTKEGHPVPAIVSATPFCDEGSFAGVLCVYTDITDRKRQETRLQEYLSTVTNNLARHTSLEGLYKFIVEAGTKFLSARDCSLFLASDEDGDALELVAAMALSPRADRLRVAIGTGPRCGLVSHVAETCEPVRLAGAELLQHPCWNKEIWTRLKWDFAPDANHSLLAAQMCLHDGRLVGVLVARDAESDEGFSEFDEVLLETLATNAAADIERVRGLEKAREDGIRIERARLETDLHEAMNVLATGVRWETEILSDELSRDNPTAAHVTLARLQGALARAYTDLRYLLEDLRDPTLEREGLLIALKKRAELIGRGRIIVHGDSWERLPPEIEGALYRVGQEAMSNALKHSGVVHDPQVEIEIWLEQSNGQVKLCVKDDGVGFDVESTLARSHKWGLRRLRDALHEMDGELNIDSAPGEGTTICATIDLIRENHEQQDPRPHS